MNTIAVTQHIDVEMAMYAITAELSQLESMRTMLTADDELQLKRAHTRLMYLIQDTHNSRRHS